MASQVWVKKREIKSWNGSNLEEKTNSFQDKIQNIKEGDIYTHEYNAPDIKKKSLNNLLYDESKIISRKMWQRVNGVK